MTEPRPDVVKALVDAGWTTAVVHESHRIRHASGAELVAYGSDNACVLYGPDTTEGVTPAATFTNSITNAVVLAACLAASGQLDPDHRTRA